MKRSILLIVFLFLLGILGLSNTAQPQSPTPTIVQVTPSEVKWKTAPSLPAGTQIAVVYGNPLKPGLYVLLLKIPPNWKNPPHTHPVEQIITVLSGTVYAGLGESFDPNKLKMFTAGSVYTEPLNTPHFTETKEEGAILQATGVGPFGTQYVNPADDPRKK
jgi:quercetin dioxygenase-like cupin family protein